MNRIFRGFCINRFCIGPLHYISSCSDFGFKFSEILYSKTDSPTQRYEESATLRINDTQSRRLSDSTTRGVDDSPHHWYAESTTPRITVTESRLLNFLKENSLYRWYGESSTPRISDAESRRLRVSLIRRVADSPYHWVKESWYGESLVEKKFV
jgi:hypothetical protein